MAGAGVMPRAPGVNGPREQRVVVGIDGCQAPAARNGGHRGPPGTGNACDHDCAHRCLSSASPEDGANEFCGSCSFRGAICGFTRSTHFYSRLGLCHTIRWPYWHLRTGRSSFLNKQLPGSCATRMLEYEHARAESSRETGDSGSSFSARRGRGISCRHRSRRSPCDSGRQRAAHCSSLGQRHGRHARLPEARLASITGTCCRSAQAAPESEHEAASPTAPPPWAKEAASPTAP